MIPNASRTCLTGKSDLAQAVALRPRIGLREMVSHRLGFCFNCLGPIPALLPVVANLQFVYWGMNIFGNRSTTGWWLLWPAAF